MAINLKKSFESVLNDIGFTFIKKRDSKSWLFSCEKEGSVWNIVVTGSYHAKNRIRLELSTSVDPNDIVYSHQLMNYREVEFLDRGFWTYRDEDEFERLLVTVERFIYEKGLSCLQVLSIPKLRPSKELSEALVQIENKSQRAALFASTYGLVPELEPSLLQLEDIMIDLRSKSVQPDWSFILECSLYIGERFRESFKGSWEWFENTVAVTNLGGKPSVGILPLVQVSHFWGNPERSSFKLTNVLRMVVELLN